MELRDKIVDFTMCNDCKHEKADEADEPCRECLTNAINEYSHTPINYEEKS